MPPKTRGSKVSKASKENIGVSCKNKTKTTSKTAKHTRKVLADKTNSTSDDHGSFLQTKLGTQENNLQLKQRPRRDRRLPSRYIENNGMQNLSKDKNISIDNETISKSTHIKRIPVVIVSPLKTPKTVLDSSLTATRPKRICRLPSKFDDHSISPSKYIPVQPAYASTPKIINKPIKQIEKKESNKKEKTKKNDNVVNKLNTRRNINKKKDDTSKIYSPNSSADTNNNAKTDELPRSKTKNKQNTSILSIHDTKSIETRKFKDKNFSIRILDQKSKSLKRTASNFDVYEFTYDPNEEPPPQKKKRKKPTKKREPKPKTFIFKDNYDKTLAKTLKSLKNTISEKSARPIAKADNAQVLTTQSCTAHPTCATIVTTVTTQPIPSNPCNSEKINSSMKNYNSVRVEDIALDFEQDDCVDDVNYSPVHSFCQPTIPVIQNDIPDSAKSVPSNNTPTLLKDIQNQARPSANNDPLNLRDDLSFFDDQPVASSSMNVSVRNPAASPWRVEFGSLPIKWQVNTYVKPNMTPAFESSFMNFNDSKKKHVYTNIVPDTNEENDLPQVYEDYASKLKQTSIISFIKEVVEKNAKKKKEKITPIKTNSVFEDLNNTSVNKDAWLAQSNSITPKKNGQSNVQSTNQDTPQTQHVNDKPNDNLDVSDTSKEVEKNSSEDSVKSSSKKKRRDKNVTYFGFDDTENHDQENVSPIKRLDKKKLRALRPRSRAVLQEINKQIGPTRAVIPVAAKSNPIQNSKVANKLFDDMKSATETPVNPDGNPVQHTEITNITEAQNDIDTNDDQSVHLFEDIEVVHHLKTHRKSYGKAKKAVTFRQNSASDSDDPSNDVADQSASNDEDDLHDLTFKVPAMEPKKTMRRKKTKKPKISKKEEKEVEAWAAGFNSMCEDIEEFDLVVE